MNSLTLVSVCKPWRGRDAAFQQAAFASWAKLNTPVVLCGRDDGVADACERFGFIHEPDVRTGNDIGLNSPAPLLSDVWAAGAKHAPRLLCYINADIIVCEDFADRTRALAAAHGPDLFVTGRRRNFDFDAFSLTAADDPLTLLPISRPHPASGADFFCCRPALFPEPIPDFVIGRVAWDNWLMWMGLAHGRPAIDATDHLLTFHPDHEHEALMAEAGRPGELRPRTHWPDAPAVVHNRTLVGERIGDMNDPRWLRLPPIKAVSDYVEDDAVAVRLK